jgi:DNA ligase-1
MEMKTFKPQLAPNEKVDLSTLSYPLLASTKLDGIRCIFYKGQILSRSLKQIQNKQLRERFEVIRAYTEKWNLILDGEIYSPKLTFQEITHFVMTQDLEDEVLPEDLKFYCFDCIFEERFDSKFTIRLNNAEAECKLFPNEIVFVEHWTVYGEEEVQQVFDKVLLKGYEGLILRDPNGKYKFGRGTIKEGLIYKVKPFVTFDAKITGVEQSTEVNEDAEKKTNELGRSVTSKKIGDRHLIEKASAFWVDYEGKPLKVILAMTDPEKVAVWANRASLIGKTIEYKGMKIGMKDGGVPRHPVYLRMRDDKDKET